MEIRIGDAQDVERIRKLNRVLTDNDPTQRLKLFAPVFPNSCPADYLRAVEACINPTSIPSAPSPDLNTPSFDIAVDHGGPFADRDPQSFRIGCWHCSAHQWNDLVWKFCCILYVEHKDVFRQIVQKVSGKRRSYFGLTVVGLTGARDVLDSGIKMETNLSANNSVALINELARLFGYEKPVVTLQ